jgi:uncharacterized membrane protein YozB (DUF420 family)
MNVTDLPALNAALNLSATVLLVIARQEIRKRNIEKHKRLMLTAFGVSVAFLISYLIYHYNVLSVPFREPEWFRPIYLVILITHVILAAVVPILAIITLRRGLRRDDARHKRIARYTYPIWLYVSATGVLIYLLLYIIFPQHIPQ